MTIKELKLELATRITICNLSKKNRAENGEYILAESCQNYEDAYKSIMELLNKE